MHGKMIIIKLTYLLIILQQHYLLRLLDGLPSVQSDADIHRISYNCRHSQSMSVRKLTQCWLIHSVLYNDSTPCNRLRQRL